MNIKGILRSSAAKLIAFAGIVGCFAGALFLTENTITDFAANGLDQMVYRFEGDFADSSYMHQQLGIMCAEMANAFEDGMDTAEFSRQHTDFAGNYFGRMGDKTVGNDTLTEAAAKKSASGALILTSPAPESARNSCPPRTASAQLFQSATTPSPESW